MPLADTPKQPPATLPDGTTGHATFESKPVGAAAIVAAEVIRRYNKETTMIEPTSTPRRWIAATVLACIIGFSVGYCAPVHADPSWCDGISRPCTAYDREHDRRAEARKLERERDLRDSLRDEQYQWERQQDTMERDWQRSLDRREREEARRPRAWYE